MEKESRFKTQQSYENGGFQMHENGSLGGNGTFKNRFSTDSSADHKRRKKSIVQITKEVLPRLENYRNSKRAVKRPSLGELHGTDEYTKVRNNYYSKIIKYA